ncbi:glycogen debranching N-terminal domain-containing protein [Anaeromyxobacter sp. PSR-1]|uniref:amylo-alpha-1,6-glucosidase n=1 Tax=unclassified Anaeromyxobacter TaxID=2620896 RepID=UPI0005DCF8BF|nr:glycogen debranching N-terminal domain-containing protein [Anaeromyxobacter sp. PSR-1]GAO03481.1 amylo-alpha-1,6-glucosidase [Anaeromyxobacter sp. PSR-1]
MDDRGAVTARPEELLGYADPSDRPEATGVDKLVLKRGNLFLVANRLGDVTPAGARDLGLFLTDTRHLSAWRMSVSGGPPLCLSSQVSSDYVAQVDFTVTSLHEGDLLGREPLNYVHLRRDMLIDDVLVDRLVLTNFQGRAVDAWIALEWAADFADVFEIRGARRRERGTYHAPRVERDQVVLRYDGRDGRRYATEVRVRGVGPDGAPAALASLDGRGARVALHLEPAEHVEVHFAVAAGIDRGAPGRARGLDEERPVPPAAPRPFASRASATHEAYSAYAAQATRFVASNDLFTSALEQAVADLKALTVYHFGAPVISAGIPWYTCPFGRDALITGYEALVAQPEVARDALRFLARLQGERDDPTRDEEPGKIPHEIRFGEMAAAGEVPHTPYYGSVDSTPLFLVLLSEYDLWTDDHETVEALLPAAERALAWMDRWADPDDDGLVEYQRRTPQGLRNQGWKDSHDGVPFADGTPAEPPIALVEVQGYCIDARRRMAALLRRMGRRSEAQALVAAARLHAERLEGRYWMEGKGTYAIALDRDERQVDAVTSNPGHLLFSGAISDARARQVAASLLGRESWSGWGIRTLAAGQRAYNPLSYHDGTVWPHDNALCAMGMSAYGMTRQAGQVLTGLWDAAQHFRQLRMPELFCGLSRAAGQFPVSYPVACSPQAWSSAAWFLLVRAVLGLHADAPRRTLRVVQPWLPPWLDELVLHGLRVGPARASLRFTRGKANAFAEVLEIQGGDLKVRIEV